jgi:spermidine/putrescine transport system substrate-binding protein
MTKIDPDLAENVLIFPDEKLLSKTYDFMGLDPEKEKAYQDDFARVIGA